MKPTQGQLEVDSEVCEGVHHYCLMNEQGKKVADTLNSGVAEIEYEYDGEDGGVHRWDAQGEADMKRLAMCWNNHDKLVQLVKGLLSGQECEGEAIDLLSQLQATAPRSDIEWEMTMDEGENLMRVVASTPEAACVLAIRNELKNDPGDRTFTTPKVWVRPVGGKVWAKFTAKLVYEPRIADVRIDIGS